MCVPVTNGIKRYINHPLEVKGLIQSKLTDFKKRDPLIEKIIETSSTPSDHNLNTRLDRIESMVQAVLINQKAGGAVTEGVGTAVIKERKIYTLRVEQVKTIEMIGIADMGAEMREARANLTSIKK